MRPKITNIINASGLFDTAIDPEVFADVDAAAATTLE
jgi:hypothetical protein